MGWFTRKPKPQYVNVEFRRLTDDRPPGVKHSVYTYIWTLPTPPETGLRVFVPGGDGRPASAMVVDGTKTPTPHEVRPVIRLATQAEVDAATAAAAADLAAWLDMARKAAGLPTAAPVRRRKPPEGYDAIPPATGEASKNDAGEYGRIWYRVWKEAESQELSKKELRAFGDIAHRWYAIRDRDKNK